MNGLEDESMAPQTFLYGCALESGKDVVFNPEDEDFEHQLDLRMACVDPSTKDELHVVEVEGQDLEGQKIKAVMASLKPSVQPSVCLGGFTLSPPVVFRLKAGSGPVHLCGQHLVMAVDDSLEEEEDDEDEEEEEEEEVKTSKKRPAVSPAEKSKKRMKKEVDDEDDDDDEDEDDDDDDEEDEEDKTPVKAKPEPTKPKAAAQNGKSSKPTTPGKNEVKTPKGKGEKSPKTATTKTPLTLEQIKEKMLEGVNKGVALPKVQAKFDNFVKNSYKVTDDTICADLWKWRQTVKDLK